MKINEYQYKADLNDSQYLEWINIIKAADLTDEEYKKDLIDGYIDDFAQLYSILNNPTTYTENEYDNLVEVLEDNIINILQYLTIFIVAFETIEDYKTADALHKIGVITLSYINVYLNQFDSYNQADVFSKEEIGKSIEIIKEFNII